MRVRTAPSRHGDEPAVALQYAREILILRCAELTGILVLPGHPGTSIFRPRLARMRERKRTHRLQVRLSQDEMQAINDFWFAEHLSSRAEAVREILRRGLAIGLSPYEPSRDSR